MNRFLRVTIGTLGITVVMLVLSVVDILLVGWWLNQWVTLQIGGSIVAVILLSVGKYWPGMGRGFFASIGIGFVVNIFTLMIASAIPGGIVIRGIGWVLAPLLMALSSYLFFMITFLFLVPMVQAMRKRLGKPFRR